MNLFVIDENNEVKINAPWIKLIPQFGTLFESKNKFLAWDRNTYAKKLLSFIYFYRDFTSPLRDWDEEPRKAEALKYTDLKASDVSTPKMKTAIEYYAKLQYEACRALKTYESSLAGLTAMDNYLKSVDFDQKDKQGKLLYTPNQYVANLALTDKAYDVLDRLANRVKTQLEQNTGIRGKAVMGDSEIKAASSNTDVTEQVAWNENVIAPDGSTQWREIDGLISKLKNKKEED